MALAIGAFQGFGNAYAAPDVNALPTGGQVTAGNASLAQSGNTMNVNQTSQRAVVDWNTFNVGQNATVKFNQPNAQASTLNRVSDSNPSQIFGKIQSQGEVVLVNQAGVYFSPTASADVGSLVASTHSISNDDYMAGKATYDRNGSTGKVINEGKIKASLGGYVAMLAPEVINSGIVVAKMGTVVLAAGERITLNFDSNKKVAGIMTTPATIATLIENKKAVKAPGGLIILSAKAVDALVGSVIKQSGTLSASTSKNDANSVAQQGGRIILDGDNIIVSAGSRTAANGNNGGGSVEIKATNTIAVEAGAKISANARTAGNGGKIIIMSENKTVVDGKISAQGGAQSGNGGLIETSSKKILELGKNLQVDAGARASTGKAGTWLLDPFDLLIDAVSSQIISAALNTSNVRVEVNALGCSGLGVCTSNGSGSLTLAADATIEKVSGALTSLTLTADGRINIFGKILSQVGAPLDVILHSSSTVTIDANANVRDRKSVV